MNIENAVVLITAAGTPTGRALAEYFGQLHAKVALVDDDPTALKATYDACIANATSCFSFLLPAMTPENIQAIFKAVSREFGQVDILINYCQAEALPHLLDADIREKDGIANLTSPLYLFGKHAAQCMIQQGNSGVIVNMPFIPAQDNPQEDEFLTTLIRGLTQSWSAELAHANIRVAGVIPKIRNIDQTGFRKIPVVNYDLIDGAVYVVQNDTFKGRVLEAVS